MIWGRLLSKPQFPHLLSGDGDKRQYFDISVCLPRFNQLFLNIWKHLFIALNILITNNLAIPKAALLTLLFRWCYPSSFFKSLIGTVECVAKLLCNYSSDRFSQLLHICKAGHSNRFALVAGE